MAETSPLLDDKGDPVFPTLSPEDLDKLAAEKASAPPNEAIYPDNLGPVDTSDPLNALGDSPDKFESAEHAAIADNLFLYRIDGSKVPAPQHKIIADWRVWTLVPPAWRTIDLYFGRLIALAGDFFTNPGRNTSDPDYTPISGAGSNDGTSLADCKRRFEGMVRAIETDYNSNHRGLSYLLDDEEKKIREVVTNDPGKEANAYHTHDGLPKDYQFQLATIGSKNAKTGLYGVLAFVNFDHFGQDAVLCYTAGHLYAIERARAAAKETDSNKKQEGLNAAYLAEAAACHYLTDLFSSGHNRAPRKGLHADSSTRLALGAVWDNLFGGTTNVWDNMCRVVHDDDSSTGIVVQNSLGDFWTAFGDKQFFMPANSVNRLRCVQCAQASIDELFNVGFRGITNVDPNSFKALKLLPQPTQCLNNNTFLNISNYNTMPLWLVTKDAEDSKQNFWYRKDPGDHADYTQAEGKPDFDPANFPHVATENKDCQFIDNNSFFKGDDEFPLTKSIDTGASGVLQLMQTIDDTLTTDWITANIYGTVSTPWANSLTLRQQARSFQVTNRTNDGIVVNACTFIPNNPTGQSYVFIFVAKPASGGNSNRSWTVFVSGYQIKDAAPFNGTASFDLNKDTQARPDITALFLNQTLLTTNDPGSDTTIQREVGTLHFFVGPYYPRTSDQAPAILAVKYSNTSSTCTIWGAKLVSDMKSLETVPSQSVDLLYGILSMKPFTRADHSTGFVAEGMPLIDTPQDWVLLTIMFQNDGGLAISMFASRVNQGLGAAMSTSWLVGSLLGPNFDDSVITDFHSAHPNFSLALRHRWEKFASRFHSCKADSANQSLRLMQPYFDGLVLSPINGASGLDIVSASLMRDHSDRSSDKPYRTYIRTHVQQPGLVLWKCYDSVIVDSLATKERIDSGYYFNVNWLMVADPGSSIPGYPGLLQVFSYYGCLGFRLYGVRGASGAKDVVFSLVGVQCFNGQTSVEMGSCVNRLFGAGILNWRKPGFVDYSVYTPITAGTDLKGGWDGFGIGSQANLGSVPTEYLTARGGKSWRWGSYKWWLEKELKGKMVWRGGQRR